MDASRFARYAWAVLGYNLAVILGGVVVRATGSGAGCGSNWPTCDGELVPFFEDSATTIEYLHRVTSALAGFAVLVLAIWAWRRFGRNTPVRRTALASLGFIIVEGLIGAALVLFEWVDEDRSMGRVVADGVHLGNTFLLVGALALTAWFASGGRPFRRAQNPAAFRLLAIGLVGLVVTGALGAIVALGDTLFPEASVSATFDNSSHYLVRMRIVHPVVAVVTGLYLAVVARRLSGATGERTTELLGAAIVGLVAAQLSLGFVNVALRAPLWMQLVHLLLAHAMWIAVLLFAASLLAVGSLRRAEAGGVAVG